MMLAGWVLSWAVGVAAAQGDEECAWDPTLWWGPRGACMEQCEVAVPNPRVDGGELTPRFQRLDADGGITDASVGAQSVRPLAGRVRGRGGALVRSQRPLEPGEWHFTWAEGARAQWVSVLADAGSPPLLEVQYQGASGFAVCGQPGVGLVEGGRAFIAYLTASQEERERTWFSWSVQFHNDAGLLTPTSAYDVWLLPEDGGAVLDDPDGGPPPLLERVVSNVYDPSVVLLMDDSPNATDLPNMTSSSVFLLVLQPIGPDGTRGQRVLSRVALESGPACMGGCAQADATLGGLLTLAFGWRLRRRRVDGRTEAR